MRVDSQTGDWKRFLEKETQGKNYRTSDLLTLIFTSSHPDIFCKKGVLKNLAKVTGKHLCQSLFFNKVASIMDLQP